MPSDRNHKVEEDINHIRQMMERSSSFLSLSGLSGIAAGLAGLLGASSIFYILKNQGIDYFDGQPNMYTVTVIRQILIVSCLTLTAALSLAFYFTYRKSKKVGQQIWSPPARNAAAAFGLPVAVGGIVCLLLLWHKTIFLVAPMTLIFYGLALTGTARFTQKEVYWLGLCEIGLGISGCFLPGYGLVFWLLGFGVLHIIYGAALYRKYK